MDIYVISAVGLFGVVALILWIYAISTLSRTTAKFTVTNSKSITKNRDTIAELRDRMDAIDNRHDALDCERKQVMQALSEKLKRDDGPNLDGITIESMRALTSRLAAKSGKEKQCEQ